MTLWEPKDLAQLCARVTGVVAEPGDPEYDKAVAIWNGSIGRRPALVVRCTNTDDVAAALAFAQDHGLEISVRGGGHGFAGYALTEGGVMIDLSLLKSVKVDPEAKRVVAGGGVNWGELDAATQEHALALPGGMISHTGIAGLALGGGIGWLCTIAGLTCDNLVGAEVVTADGSVHRISETEEPDLLWGLKGGGGNFGVVTAFEFRLHDVGPLVNFASFHWGLDQGREALRLARDVIATLPSDTAAFITSSNAPDAPYVPEEVRSKPGWVLAIVGFGDAGAHADLIAPVRSAVPPLFEHVEQISYTTLQGMFDDTAPWGAMAYEKAVHLDELTDEVIDVLVEHQPRKSAPLSFTPILVAGGAFRDIPEESAAFSGSRDARYIVNITAVCPTPELFEKDRLWVREYWAALVPHASNTGSYVNFMSEFDEDRVRAAYGPEKYERLVDLKAKYDPDNVFHLNANIKPRTA